MARQTIFLGVSSPNSKINLTLRGGLEQTSPWGRLSWSKKIALGAILLLSAWLHFFQLGQEGFSHLYYAASVKSMLANWHNFFFASFDPSGFSSLDKPPLGVWFQVISASIFGYNSFSLLLPQALAGVLSVALLYGLVKHIFGPAAGLVAALVLTLTPISVAADRTTNMDSTLVFTLLLAAWAFTFAVETGKLSWLLAGSFLIGLAFNIKMLQAYLVLPACFILYFLAAPLTLRKRLVNLSLATLLLLIVSFSWAFAVDLTPPDQRPFVGGTQHNSVIELIIGYNGVDRLLGTPLSDAEKQLPGALQKRQAALTANQIAHAIGAPEILRFYNKFLSGQISWLLPLALLCLVMAAKQATLKFPLKPGQQALFLWTAWLLPQLVFYSFANQFHPHYLELLSPSIAALIGMGMGVLWQNYNNEGWQGWLLPLALALTAILQLPILDYYPEWYRWLAPFIVGGALISVFFLVIIRCISFLNNKSINKKTAFGLMSVGFAALLVAPAIWSSTPALGIVNGIVPTAGPELLARYDASLLKLAEVQNLATYLTNHHREEKYLAVTYSAVTAAPLIILTGQPVIAIGGYSGNEHTLSTKQFINLFVTHQVRYLLFSNPGISNEITVWVSSRCIPINPSSWQTDNPNGGKQRLFGPLGEVLLLDCEGKDVKSK